MNRILSTIFILLSCILLIAPAAFAQCLQGDCVNGDGVKLTRGHKYSGSFKNNHRNGFGLYEYPNGDTYEGQFVDGIIQGEGIYYFANGDRYEGTFKQDKRDGVGTYYPKEGHVLRGVWKDNVLVQPEQMVVSEDLNDTSNLDEDLNPLSENYADEKNATGTDEPSEEDIDALVDDILK